MFKALIAKRIAKIAAGGIGALLAAVGGITSIGVLQPAVEKAADYAAKAVESYCELPLVDRSRFRDEVNERLANAAIPLPARIEVTCPTDQP